MSETWKPISDFPGYFVSDIGRVKGPRKILKPLPTARNRAYVYVCLYRDRLAHHRLIHRLVAEAFVPNPHGLPTVNHENGIKTDCKASNLKWSSKSRQQRHALKLGLRKRYGKGVSYDRARQQWLAHTKVNGKFKNLGRFDFKADAIKARDRFIKGLQ